MIFDLFKNSNATLELINDYVQTRTDDPNLFESNIINEDNLDDWTIDDFFTALPKTIEGRWDTICEFHLWYTKEDNNWNAAYDTPWGDHIYETSNIDKYECLKELYFKIKNL